MQQHPELMLDLNRQRQAQVRTEVAKMQPRASGHDPGMVRQRLGTMLIALGQRLVGSAATDRALPAGLRVTAAQHA